MNDARNELLTQEMGKLFCKLALPAVIGMVAIGLYQLVDAVFVGNMVGKEALAAISLVYPLTLINNSIAVLFGVGSASVLSRAMGSGDKETVNGIFGNLTLWVILCSLVSTAVFFFFAEPLVRFMGVDDEIIVRHGTNYLRIIAFGSVFVNFAQASNMLIRGEGRMKDAMLIMGLGTVLNIILDPIFIKVLGWGIEGAAGATVVSQVVIAVLGLIYFKKGGSSIPAKRIRISLSITLQVLSVGVSAMIMLLMGLVQQTVMYKSIAIYGNGDDIAVVGAAVRLMSFAFLPVWGISQGLQPVVGMNFGAKNYERVKEAFGFFTGLATVFTGIAWVCFMSFPKGLLGWFINDPVLIDAGYPYIRLMLAAFITLGFMIMTITLFQAIGKGGEAAFAIMGRQVLFFIPLVFLLSRLFGMTGIILATPISDILVCVISLFMLIPTFRKMNSSAAEKDLV